MEMKKKKREKGVEMEENAGEKNKGKQSTKETKSNFITEHFIENTSYRIM